VTFLMCVPRQARHPGPANVNQVFPIDGVALRTGRAVASTVLCMCLISTDTDMRRPARRLFGRTPAVGYPGPALPTCGTAGPP
jgi:hypothetical protein